MRSQLTILPVVALAFAIGAPRVEAQSRIAVADIQAALLRTKDGVKAAEEIKTKYGPKEAEFNKRSQDLAAKQSQYQKAAATLSEEAKASAERDIQTLTKNLQRDADDTKADFQAEEQRLLGPIMEKMRAVVNRYASENQLTMVVDVSQGQQGNNVLFADAASNITLALAAAYDKAESSTALTAPPAAKAPAAAKPATMPKATPASAAAPK
ncbi:MAG: OmpH family outer membrane protein [Bryobacteraceae bacterium]